MNYKEKYFKYKEKYLLLKGGDLKENIILLKDLTLEQKQYLFNMYDKTYSSSGNQLWFKSSDELFNSFYTCGIIINNDFTEQFELTNIKAYCIFQKKKYINKISITCHDGTSDGKNTAIQLRLKYVNIPNWIIEASGATAWILRKNKSPCIINLNTIKKLLEIDEIKEQIEINEKFTIEDFNNIDNNPNKELFHYYHIYNNNNNIFRNKETLFGISGCDNFDNDTCDRKCV